MNNALGIQQPRYLQLAQTLISEIQNGSFPVGALMPTEFELCEQFGASRFTVRAAVRQLVERGMVARQAGVGTKVLATQAAAGYKQVMQQISDLRRYTEDTQLEILDKQMLDVVTQKHKELLNAAHGETWLMLRAVRRSADQADPICYSEVFIHPAFRALNNLPRFSVAPIYTLIESQFGEQVVEVQQDIEAMALNAEQAKILNAKPRSPALLLCRRYLNRKGQLIEMATSIHPADRFRYSEVFRRDWQPGPVP